MDAITYEYFYCYLNIILNLKDTTEATKETSASMIIPSILTSMKSNTTTSPMEDVESGKLGITQIIPIFIEANHSYRKESYSRLLIFKP